LLAGSFASVEAPAGRLNGLIGLSPALPLLPVGFALYLVGGGHRRHRRERPWTGALHGALLPLGLILLLLLPAVTIHDAATLVSQRQVAPLPPMQQHLLNPVRLITTLLLQGVTGAGLLLIRHQGRRQMRRVGLTPALFFRTDATGPVRQHRRRSTDNGQMAYEIRRARNVSRAWRMLKRVTAGVFICAVALVASYGYFSPDFNPREIISEIIS
jgi:hypothetical protein